MAKKDEVLSLKQKVDSGVIKAEDVVVDTAENDIETEFINVVVNKSNTQALSPAEISSMVNTNTNPNSEISSHNDNEILKLDKMAMETTIVPITDSEHPTMDVDSFNQLQRTPKVNNRILIMVRHKSSPLMNHETMVDLMYYDESKKEMINSNAIPNFYKKQYKGLYGNSSFIFYCNIADMPAIKRMLTKDKQANVSRQKVLDDFLKDIN